MRLIDTKTLQLKEYWGGDIPRYAILSHTWETEEVTFQQFTQLSRDELSKLKGFSKIQRTCQLARRSGIQWAWVDTCCIDKTSSAELTEAINSMFRWYRDSAVCYAYLSDLKEDWIDDHNTWTKAQDKSTDDQVSWIKNQHKSTGNSEDWTNNQDTSDSEKGSGNWNETENWKDSGTRKPAGREGATNEKAQRLGVQRWGAAWQVEETNDPTDTDERVLRRARVARLGRCRWFTRGWTLQELIAPRRLGFYNQSWGFEGEKETLKSEISEITRISEVVLSNASLLPTIAVAQRMSWAANRETTRSEDTAYCLLGIFGVQMPMLYGEGSRAFLRLQEEIIKEVNDLSLFAWKAIATPQRFWGILAASPKQFADCADVELDNDPMYNNELVMTSKGLRVTPTTSDNDLRTGQVGKNYTFNLRCGSRSPRKNMYIYLQQHGADVFVRVSPEELTHRVSGGGGITDRVSPRPFYISKFVLPLLSIALGSSHRNAIDMWRAIPGLHRAGLYLVQHDSSIFPAGHWDAERRMFLTEGASRFNCRMLFKNREGLVIRVGCLLLEGRVSVELSIDISTTSAHSVRCGASRAMLEKEVSVFNGVGNHVTWIQANVSRESFEGQPVHYVAIGTPEYLKERGY